MEEPQGKRRAKARCLMTAPDDGRPDFAADDDEPMTRCVTVPTILVPFFAVPPLHYSSYRETYPM